MNTGLREKTKEPSFLAVFHSWALREKTKEGRRLPVDESRYGKRRPVSGAGDLSIVHRRGRGSAYLGRWARTPALASFFRPMLLEDWKPVKIAIQDCLTW